MKNVCFTSFNMDIDWFGRDYSLLDKKSNIKYMVIQGELCKDGKKHIQGFIQFHNKKRMDFIKKLLTDNTLHIEPMRGTPEQARRYCTNEYTDEDGNSKDLFHEHYEYGTIDYTTHGQRTDLVELKNKIIEGAKLQQILIDSTDSKEIHNILQYNKPLKALQDEVQRTSTKQKLLKQYEGVVWRTIQKHILSLIDKDVDDRKVHWVYDEDGNSGKSYLAKYLQLTRDVYYITGGKQNDILYGYDGEEIVLIDLARTYADNIEHIYTIIENIKNGQYLSTKYETKQKLFQIPHIIVLANFKPDTTKLSRDRWDIIDTDDYQEPIDNSWIDTLPPMIPKKRQNIKKSV